MRGQAALEMFLALTITLLLLLWVNNYAESFASTGYSSSVSTQQRIAMKALSSTINSVCAHGGKATIDTPCIKRKADDVYYRLQLTASLTNSYVLYNEISESTESVNSPCSLTAFDQRLRCSETPELCVAKSAATNQISVTAGACT